MTLQPLSLYAARGSTLHCVIPLNGALSTRRPSRVPLWSVDSTPFNTVI